MLKNKRVLIIGPLPNPISGVSLANKVVKKILDKSTAFKTNTINTSYPVFKDSVGSFSFHKLFFFLKLNFKALKVFKNDIIYITPGQTFFGVTKYSIFILLASILNKELVIHVHGNYLGKQYKKLKGIKKKTFYFLVSKFTKGIVLSSSLKNNLLPFLDESKIFIVYNFAEDYLYNNSNTSTFNKLKIIYLSNLMEEKGILFLLEALKELEKQDIVYEAKIAGNIDESLKAQIIEKVNNLKHTTYEGVVYGKEKKKLLEWSNIFVLPTFYKMEGQPISILEALATENVIIATNHAGIPDIIKTEINGYIVAPKSANSILEPLLFLDKNKFKIKEITSVNKKYFIDNFTVKNFTEKITETLNASTKVK
ncbi:glycosyltransferase family 4 protein [Polaribacter batillariae]|uniref:Glycosyltransferase family 4 protein n=1 Tax=Polaribacter batillariae TaxID=2808900 RepID=A0ABX7SPS5_9FLAO|nr:glycosyltransferase family 4 protein [Polaribacter batillariae]QTD36215.1 glycosyltransferase family 4 protein [Polaribacter batillariae]